MAAAVLTAVAGSSSLKWSREGQIGRRWAQLGAAVVGRVPPRALAWIAMRGFGGWGRPGLEAEGCSRAAMGTEGQLGPLLLLLGLLLRLLRLLRLLLLLLLLPMMPLPLLLQLQLLLPPL
jgi:hypothetical protein